MSTKLILTRKGEWINRRQQFRVFINGKEVGLIKNDKTEEYELEPGIYTVQCKVNWTSSPAYNAELKEGKNTYLRVSNGMKFILPLYIMMFAGVLLPFYFRFAKIPIPDSVNILKTILIIPAVLYILFYVIFYRKKYLFIGEDTSNPFN